MFVRCFTTRLLTATAVAAGIVSWSQPGSALTITVDFAGQVTSVSDSGNQLGGSITVGTPFSGQLVYSSTMPDGNPAPTDGSYLSVAPPVMLTLTAAGLSTSSTTLPSILVVDDRDVIISEPTVDDLFRANDSGGVIPTTSLVYTGSNFSLADTTAAALSSDALPTTFDLADFDLPSASFSCHVSFNPSCMTSWSVFGEVSSVSVTAAPESSTALLVVSGLASLVARRWRSTA